MMVPLGRKLDDFGFVCVRDLIDARDQFVAFAVGAVVGVRATPSPLPTSELPCCCCCCHVGVLTPQAVAELGRSWVVCPSRRLVLHLTLPAVLSSLHLAFSVSPTLGVVDRPRYVDIPGRIIGWIGGGDHGASSSLTALPKAALITALDVGPDGRRTGGVRLCGAMQDGWWGGNKACIPADTTTTAGAATWGDDNDNDDDRNREGGEGDGEGEDRNVYSGGDPGGTKVMSISESLSIGDLYASSGKWVVIASLEMRGANRWHLWNVENIDQFRSEKSLQENRTDIPVTWKPNSLTFVSDDTLVAIHSARYGSSAFFVMDVESSFKSGKLQGVHGSVGPALPFCRMWHFRGELYALHKEGIQLALCGLTRGCRLAEFPLDFTVEHIGGPFFITINPNEPRHMVHVHRISDPNTRITSFEMMTNFGDEYTSREIIVLKHQDDVSTEPPLHMHHIVDATTGITIFKLQTQNRCNFSALS